MIRTNNPSITGILPYDFNDSDEYIGSKIKGVLTPIGRIVGTISTGVKAREYEGPYSVVSQIGNDIQLNVQNKLSAKNIVVRAIPFLRIQDDLGGEIAIIGKEA